MKKTFNGLIVSTKRENIVSVEVVRKVQHPKYKKLMTRSKKFSAQLDGQKVKLGDNVTITETRPISKTVHFKVTKVDGKENKKI